MARITVEDCLENVDNLFELVLIASRRARQLANGANAMVEWENDKPTVVALREIADGFVDKSILEEVDEPDAEEVAAAELVAADLAASAVGPGPIEPMPE